MNLSFSSFSPLQIQTRTRSSYTTNSGMKRNFAFFYDWETPLMSAIRHCFPQKVSRTRYSYTYITWYMTSKKSKACIGEPEIYQVFMPRGVFRFICQVQSCVFRTEHEVYFLAYVFTICCVLMFLGMLQ